MDVPEVVTVGRVSVDLYARELDVGFDGQQSFTKSVGGSPTNVAVAAARLGRRAAIVTKVGDDDFGSYVRLRLREFGVLTDYVGTQPGGQTPLALAALDPPETPQVAFYRGPAAPDTQLQAGDLPDAVLRDCGLLWMSQGALASGPTAASAMTWLTARAKAGHTILDLDYRPALWPSVETARAAAAEAIALATVVVGNLDECEMAVETRNPDSAADRLLARGVDLAIIKQGADGALFANRSHRWVIAPTPIAVVCGLGAGDAFGGALSHGLLAGWDVDAVGRFASAAGAYVAARLTCADDMPTEARVRELIEEST
ncbi:MAG: PfkB family carbohydrate kinase [Actinomycetes bacterium]